MKIALVVLILCFFINIIPAFSWFGFRWTQPPKQITELSSTQRSTFHFQRSRLQQHNQLRNVTNPLRKAIIAFYKNNANHSPLQRIVNRQQYQVRHTTAVHRQANHAINNTNNQIIHSRFRSFLRTNKNNTSGVNPANHRVFPSASLSKPLVADSKPNSSSIIKHNIQPIRSRLALATAVATDAKTDLHRALPSKANVNNGIHNRQRLLSDFYYQRVNKQNAAPNHLNRNLAMRKRRYDPGTMINTRSDYDFPGQEISDGY